MTNTTDDAQYVECDSASMNRPVASSLSATIDCGVGMPGDVPTV